MSCRSCKVLSTGLFTRRQVTAPWASVPCLTLAMVTPAAFVACTRLASVMGTSYTALSTHHPSCDGSSERFGRNCNAAIHRFCRSMGFASGFGPVENSGDTAFVACVSD